MNGPDIVRPQEREDKLYAADPALLIKHNPAALVVNNAAYQDLAEHFSPEQFEPLDIVRVKTYASGRGQVIKPLVIDGLTRLKYTFDNKGKAITYIPSKKKDPDGEVAGEKVFNFDAIPVRDITHAMTINLSVVDKEQQIFAENGLSVLQYLKAVMPYACSHRNIAEERVGALMMGGWDNIVGRVTAKNISSLQALRFLRSSFRPLVARQLCVYLEDFLSHDKAFLVELPADEKLRIHQGLIAMARIISDEGFDIDTLSRATNAVTKERKAQKDKTNLEDLVDVQPAASRRPQSGV